MQCPVVVNSHPNRSQKKGKANKSNLFWIEVADSIPGQVAFALNFGPIVEKKVCTPVMNTQSEKLLS